MARAATATINLNAIVHNYRLAKSTSTDGYAVAVIKADAYGHSAVRIAEALSGEADAFAVACIEEALELRTAGIQEPILLLEGFFETAELEIIAAQNLWCAIHSTEQIDALAQAELSAPLTIWLKMDSGMHRLGIAPEQYRAAYEQLSRLKQVQDIVLMTHLSCADEPDNPATQAQITTFKAATAGLPAAVSIANSAGLLAHADSRATWQRPGIMLYGASPFIESQSLADQLQPAMTLTSEIIAIRDLQEGDAVGYSRTWVCDKPSRIGTVALGYADGYPRHAKNGTPVLVNGQRTQLVGRVSMDMLAVDLSDLSDVEVGAKVELWGENLLATEVAQHCDTIPYTLFTGITKRVHKRYV